MWCSKLSKIISLPNFPSSQGQVTIDLVTRNHRYHGNLRYDESMRKISCKNVFHLIYTKIFQETQRTVMSLHLITAKGFTAIGSSMYVTYTTYSGEFTHEQCSVYGSLCRIGKRSKYDIDVLGKGW